MKRNTVETDTYRNPVPIKTRSLSEDAMSTVFAREVRLVEFIARHLWRWIRFAVRRHLSQRCRNCVLPDSAAALDKTGLCHRCRTHFDSLKTSTPTKNNEAKTKKLDNLFKHYSGLGKGTYDALLLFSGGKDSTYLLHRMVTAYPDLRLLTVLVDNGFMSPVALTNAKRVLKRFDVDHITVKPQASFVKKAFRHTLTNLKRQNGYSTVDLLDGHITFDAAKNIAAREEIPLILCGLSNVQAEQVFGIQGMEFPPEQERAPLISHAGIILRDVFTEQEMLNWFDGSQFPKERIPRFIFPFCVWDIGEAEILEAVSTLGLLNKQCSSPLVTNNMLIPVIGMAETAHFGYSCFEVEFARMVREGKSDRTYWLNLFEMLEYSTKTGRFINGTVTATLARLGLSKKDLGIGLGCKSQRQTPETLLESIQLKVKHTPHATAFHRETSSGWEARTHLHFHQDILKTAHKLHALGVRKGHRVAVLANACYEWEVADKAIMYLGGITVGLDCRSTEQDINYVLKKTDTLGVFVEDEELSKLLPTTRLCADGFLIFLNAPKTKRHGILELPKILEAEQATPPPCKVDPDDFATIIFTSGTTGRPKGIPFRHRQLTSGLECMRNLFAQKLGKPHKALVWLSSRNGTGRMMSSLNYHLGVTSYFVRDPLTLREKLQTVQPTFLVAVPRMLEKIYAGIHKQMRTKPLPVRMLLLALLRIRGLLPYAPIRNFIDWAFARRLRTAIWGAQLQFLITGSAPVDPKILRFFHAMGVPTYEVYGLSEIGSVVTMNRPGKARYGSVGRPLSSMDLRLAPDGEILVKTPAVFEHYWGASPGDSFDENGWFKTGDLGRFEKGSLYLTGRKKELIKTSTGWRVSPNEIERIYKNIPGIEQLVVIGNGRKCLAALVTMDPVFLSSLRHSHIDPVSYLSREAAKYHGKLSRQLQVNKFVLLPRPLSADHGEITNTMKVRRAVVEHEHQRLINTLYAEEIR